MSRRPTDRLIAELVRDLEPVRRIPPLSAVALGLLGAWLAGVAASWLLGGADLRLGEPGGLDDPLFTALLLALALAGLGGCLAVAARAVPGRERLAGAGLWGLSGGLALALGIGLLAWLAARTGTAPAPAVGCATHAFGLSLAPALLAFAWLARAWEPWPSRAAPVATLAAAALGASAVHASCITGDALHMLLGHVAGPLLAALLLAGPGSAWLVRHAAARGAQAGPGSVE